VKIRGKHYCLTQSRVILFMLMKSSAKAKSFHVMARGNFPAARDLAEPSTYTTPRRGRRRKNMINRNHHRNDQSSTDNLTVTKTSIQRPSPYELYVERAGATQPSDPTSDPSSEPSSWKHGPTVVQAVGQPPGKRRPPSDPSSEPLPRSRVRAGAQAASRTTVDRKETEGYVRSSRV